MLDASESGPSSINCREREALTAVRAGRHRKTRPHAPTPSHRRVRIRQHIGRRRLPPTGYGMVRVGFPDRRSRPFPRRLSPATLTNNTPPASPPARQCSRDSRSDGAILVCGQAKHDRPHRGSGSAPAGRTDVRTMDTFTPIPHPLFPLACRPSDKIGSAVRRAGFAAPHIPQAHTAERNHLQRVG